MKPTGKVIYLQPIRSPKKVRDGMLEILSLVKAYGLDLKLKEKGAS